MPVLKNTCDTCGKEAKLQSRFTAFDVVHEVLQCGHLRVVTSIVSQHPDIPLVEDVEPFTGEEIDEATINFEVERMLSEGHHIYASEDTSFYSVDKSMHAYPFQVEGVHFAEKANLRCLIADAMGLGKTVQSLVTYKRNIEAMTPLLIVIKGSTQFQWGRMFASWVTDDPFALMPILGRSNFIPGFKVYTISMDLLSRKGILDLLAKLNIKAVIIDEVQNFKDTQSARTGAMVKFLQDNNIEYLLALSGTPIKNKVGEYFPILNWLDPVTFTNRRSFNASWLIPNDKGYYTRLNPLRAERFKELTSQYIIRREKHEVLTNLPALTRDYQLIEIEDEVAKDSYNQELELFDNFLHTASRVTSNDILGWLAKLRAITGRAKLPNAVQWTDDFLESTDESLCIGIHHKSVRDALKYAMSVRNITCASLSGEDDVWTKDRVARDFNAGKNRVLVLNAIAGGVGLNLQSCANALLLERLWNPADEEQFISRFHRDGQRKAVTITYMIAKGTLDEWFHEMVYKKSQISTEAGIAIAPFNDNEGTSDINFLKEFSEFVVSNKLR